jgi:hypothetical protein
MAVVHMLIFLRVMKILVYFKRADARCTLGIA